MDNNKTHNPYQIIELITKTKDSDKIKSYFTTAQDSQETLPSYIMCKLLSRTNLCENEPSINVLGLLSLTPTTPETQALFLSKVLPRTNSYCPKW